MIIYESFNFNIEQILMIDPESFGELLSYLLKATLQRKLQLVALIALSWLTNITRRNESCFWFCVIVNYLSVPVSYTSWINLLLTDFFSRPAPPPTLFIEIIESWFISSLFRRESQFIVNLFRKSCCKKKLTCLGNW